MNNTAIKIEGPDFSILGEIHEPGIYFGMTDDEYHKDPSCSTSVIKDLLIGPLDCWSNSRMNPEYEEKNTDAMRNGKAYHKMFLEGRKAFEATYAVKPDPADYEGVLKTAADMKAWLKVRDLPVGGSNMELVGRIREIDDVTPLWPEIMAEFEKTEKTVLPFEVYKNIIRAGLILNRLPSVKQAFTNGYSEVSVFWIDKKTIVPMKCRFDYLKTDKTIDLKTFANSTGDEIQAAVAKAVCNQSYHVQVAVYSDGCEQAKAMLKRHGVKAVKRGEVPAKWLDEFMYSPPHPWFFVFVQSGNVPNIIGREFCRRESYAAAGGSALTEEWKEGDFLYRWKVDEFRKFVAAFGTDPWVVDLPVKPFATTDFPMWMFPARRAE